MSATALLLDEKNSFELRRDELPPAMVSCDRVRPGSGGGSRAENRMPVGVSTNPKLRADSTQYRLEVPLRASSALRVS